VEIELKKKRFYPVGVELESYLAVFGRALDITPIFEDLHRFSELFPLFDRDGNDTLWKTVQYDSTTRADLNEQLTLIYSLLKTGDIRTVKHLRLERVDYCEFGNSRPFRIRIVNEFNDNYDHFYVKVADASRIYGLELEHILSPNRINYLVNGHTLVEEHIAGVPGDVFIREWFDHPDTRRVRVAKEFVKFNERCFIRLLGDMRSYNYVIDITPDFEDVQYRVRAIDFDQQSYEGSKEMYMTQFSPENRKVVDLCAELLNYPTMQQYQNEERALMKRRAALASRRLDALFDVMRRDEISTPEKTAQLRSELAEYHHSDAFNSCETMGELVEANVTHTLSQPAAAESRRAN
jgi:hypothetical protein